MKDILKTIYDSLILNEFIRENCYGRIKFYSYPETADTTKPFIVIAPSKPSEPSTNGSNTHLTESYFVQINIESTDRTKRNEIVQNVRDTMLKIGFVQNGGGFDTYFTETKRYVDARIYSAILFD